jgi:hypothetical protein
MASTFTSLGVELMATGENAGTWGTKTNTNLNIIEQISGGYATQAVAGTGATNLIPADGATGSSLANRVIELTGTITANIQVTVPVDVTNFYFIKNTTSGAYTVEFKYISGSGSSVTFGATDKGTKIINAEGNSAVNPDMTELTVAAAAGTTGQVQINNSGAFGAVAEGTSGFILTSKGTGSPPVFEVNTGVSTGKAIAMAMIFG